jgi:hypothetical protein
MATIASPPDGNCAVSIDMYSVTPTLLGVTVLAAPPDTRGGENLYPPTQFAVIG